MMADAAMTANLQPALTVKVRARIANVSERLIYMAMAVYRLRPDLADEVDAGRMSVAKAHRIATGKAKATSWDRLLTAWNNATDDDRGRLVFAIVQAERGPE